MLKHLNALRTPLSLFTPAQLLTNIILDDDKIIIQPTLAVRCAEYLILYSL